MIGSLKGFGSSALTPEEEVQNQSETLTSDEALEAITLHRRFSLWTSTDDAAVCSAEHVSYAVVCDGCGSD